MSSSYQISFFSATLLLKQPVTYDRVIACCDNVLEIESKNTKALYRKAVSKYHKNDFEASLELFNSAKVLPNGETG